MAIVPNDILCRRGRRCRELLPSGMILEDAIVLLLGTASLGPSKNLRQFPLERPQFQAYRGLGASNGCHD